MENVIGFEALEESAYKCIRGVVWKDSVASYYLNDVERTTKLCSELHDGTYQEGEHKYFTITEPKRRDIMSIKFRDRVYQRSLNDNAIYPQISKSFIYDNCACQKGKGTDFARDRLNCHLQRYFRKHGNDGYVLQCDIRGYYPNMRHDVAKEVFSEHLDAETYAMAANILDGFVGDVGFNPGSQIIQIAGISVLNGLDHAIKERLRVKHYIRYMDDMILISDSMESLNGCKMFISDELSKLGFELHPKKTRIFKIRDGINFLGFKFMLTDTGKVVRIIDPNKVKHERKKLRRLVALAKSGKITRKKCDECFNSWKAHAKHGDSHKLLRAMEQYYERLWCDDQQCKISEDA